MTKRQNVATFFRSLNCLWWDFSSVCMADPHLCGQFWITGVVTIKCRIPPSTFHFRPLSPSLSVSAFLPFCLLSSTDYDALLVIYLILITVHEIWPSFFKLFNSYCFLASQILILMIAKNLGNNPNFFFKYPALIKKIGKYIHIYAKQLHRYM